MCRVLKGWGGPTKDIPKAPALSSGVSLVFPGKCRYFPDVELQGEMLPFEKEAADGTRFFIPLASHV